MEFCVLAPQLRSALDKLLIRLFADQWRDLKISSEHTTGFLDRLDHEVERIRSWSTELESSEKVFKRELFSARKNLEEVAATSSRPSRELEDYSVPSSSNLGAKGFSTSNLQSPLIAGPQRAEKHGWLFLRTLTGKPTRTVWVRRWFFVRNGIFGWLISNTRTGGVEESEQIGVLLCAVRPASQEERRFCFEVKTKDNTILLQAETQTELADWFQVFERAKEAVLKDDDDEVPQATRLLRRDAAFAINPPSALAFATRSQDSQSYPGTDDGIGPSFDKSTTFPISDRELRTNFETSSRRSTTSEREGEGVRDSAARIIQKLDLHRKSAAGSQLASAVLGGPHTAGSGPPAGAIASLIAAGHNVNSGSAAPGANLLANASLTELNPANVFAASQAHQRAQSTSLNVLAPPTLTNPPAPTNFSKTAVIVSGERSNEPGSVVAGGVVPNGMMANFWGTVSVPIVNSLEAKSVKSAEAVAQKSVLSAQEVLGNLDGRDDIPAVQGANVADNGGASLQSNSPFQPPVPKHRSTTSTDNAFAGVQQAALPVEDYPPNYPIQLKMQDAQFRLLFPSAQRQEKVVLVFRATWNPDEQQDFPGRVYVTESGIHFYSHHLGLVLVSSVSFGIVDGVTTTSGTDFDYLYLNLKEGSTSAGFTRITIKNFLEDIRLLQKRLNFLIQSFHTGKPLHLEATLKDLLAMESDTRVESPSVESWEAVSIDTPHDEGPSRVRSSDGRKEKDLRTTIRIDRNLDSNAEIGIKDKEVTRLQLPAEPVTYVPHDIVRVSQEREFAISAKALFHVMFGDKSTVFQMLFLERRATRKSCSMGIPFMMTSSQDTKFGNRRKTEPMDSERERSPETGLSVPSQFSHRFW